VCLMSGNFDFRGIEGHNGAGSFLCRLHDYAHQKVNWVLR